MPRKKQQRQATPDEEEYLFLEVLEKLSPQTYDIMVPEGTNEYIDVIIDRVAQMFPRVYKNVLDRMEEEADRKGLELEQGIQFPTRWSDEDDEEIHI